MDLRILKTKKSLYDALLHLMGEQTFESIKVSEICSKAMTNRSTFYAHFEDKYALLNSLIQDLKEELQKELEKNAEITNSKEYYMDCMRILLFHLEEHQDIYFPLIINNRNSIAMDMIYDTLLEDVSKRICFDHQDGMPAVEYVSHFYLGAILHVMMKWMQKKCCDSREEILKYLDALIPDKISVGGSHD